MKEVYFAIYQGDTFVNVGTQKEMAKMLNVKEETIYFYTTNTYRKRLEKRKNKQSIIAIRLED